MYMSIIELNIYFFLQFHLRIAHHHRFKSEFSV
jgi:hypothetical protein